MVESFVTLPEPPTHTLLDSFYKSLSLAPLVPPPHQRPYFITGSIASIFYGEPRLTHDVDVVVHLSPPDLTRFSELFPLEQFYCPPPEEVITIEAARRPFDHFNLIHHESGFKADIYPDGEDRLHQWAFSRRKRIELGDGNAIWLAPPEYVIIRKLEYFREGGSEKHLEDIRKMLPQIGTGLDMLFLDSELNSRGLSAHWERARSLSSSGQSLE